MDLPFQEPAPLLSRYILKLLSVCICLAIGQVCLAQEPHLPHREIAIEEILAIIPTGEFEPERPFPIGPKWEAASVAYQKRKERAAKAFYEGPTRKLAEFGSAAFASYRKLLAKFSTDSRSHYQAVDFIGRAFELMPEHQEEAKDMFFQFLELVKGSERNEQVAALNYFCKFATKADMPRLMHLLETQEADVVRRILQLGDDSHIAQLETWVEANRTTEMQRMQAGVAPLAGGVPLRYLQIVETEILEHKARVAAGSNSDRGQRLPAPHDSWLSQFVGDGILKWWWAMVVLLLTLAMCGMVWLRRVRRGHRTDGKSD